MSNPTTYAGKIVQILVNYVDEKTTQAEDCPLLEQWGRHKKFCLENLQHAEDSDVVAVHLMDASRRVPTHNVHVYRDSYVNWLRMHLDQRGLLDENRG